MTNVVPFDEPVAPIPPKLKCSFCGKQERDVRRIVSNNLEGSALRAICDECLNKCKARMEEHH